MVTVVGELCAPDIWYKFNELNEKNVSEGVDVDFSTYVCVCVCMCVCVYIYTHTHTHTHTHIYIYITSFIGRIAQSV